MVSEKEYKFDEKLISNNIRLIEREEFNRYIANVRCDRCNALLKRFVAHIRIDDEDHMIGNNPHGDNCYDSIIRRLSEIRGKSIYWVKIDVEGVYNKYLERKWSTEKLSPVTDKNTENKRHQDYSKFKELEWDIKHGNPPKFKREEYEELKKKFKPK